MINSQLGPGENESVGLGLTNASLRFKASLCWKRTSGTDEFLNATLEGEVRSRPDVRLFDSSVYRQSVLESIGSCRRWYEAKRKKAWIPSYLCTAGQSHCAVGVNVFR